MSLFAKAAEKIGKRLEQSTEDALALIPKVSPKVREERLNICLSCDKLYTPTKSCKLCGCFMVLKTWLPGQNCPINKWGRAEPESKK